MGAGDSSAGLSSPSSARISLSNSSLRVLGPICLRIPDLSEVERALRLPKCCGRRSDDRRKPLSPIAILARVEPPARQPEPFPPPKASERPSLALAKKRRH